MQDSLYSFIDTGARTAVENIALDASFLEAREKDIIPNTFRLLQFSKPAVLIGYHQRVEEEVRSDYCIEKNIDINRRITGGGAIFFDKSQIGWEIIAGNEGKVVSYKKLCDGLILALKIFGLTSKFRPKNDIEINGRKISGTGGVFEKKSFLFQGTLLVDFDVDTMLRALRIPLEKLKDKEIEGVKDRVTCLRDELGYIPKKNEIKSALINGFEKAYKTKFFEVQNLGKEFEKIYKKNLKKFGSKKWIYGEKKIGKRDRKNVLYFAMKTKGGLVRATVVVDVEAEKINYCYITGDFFISPKRMIYDLEAKLKELPIEKMKKTIWEFFNGKDYNSTVLPNEYYDVIKNAVKKIEFKNYNIKLNDANSIFTVKEEFKKILEKKGKTALLLPYCAKLIDCEYRHKNYCSLCGLCNVGDAYKIGIKNSLEPMTITSFEHLMRTLRKIESNGYKRYIGCCCEQFYIKHKKDFERFSIPGILIDIDSKTCYELGKEREAYEG
ncbi:MAG: DUF116 domain-containing protein, partial [Candidatus Thermoplasmatota archaeon]